MQQGVAQAGQLLGAEVGFVGAACLQALEGGGLVAEGFQKGQGEALRITELAQGLGKELGDGFFDFDSVHLGGVDGAFKGARFSRAAGQNKAGLRPAQLPHAPP